MLSLVEHEKSFMTSGPGWGISVSQPCLILISDF